MSDLNYGNNGEQTVNFEYNNGFKGVVTKSVGEILEAKKQGTIIKGTPKPVNDVTSKDTDK
jgi:hypothetical protein